MRSQKAQRRVQDGSVGKENGCGVRDVLLIVSVSESERRGVNEDWDEGRNWGGKVKGARVRM